jgi:hypothetical protein
MARSLLIFIFLSFSMSAYSDFLGFKTSNSRSRIPAITEKIMNLKIEPGPVFEDSFNQLIKSLEVTLEEEKLFCAGESADNTGKVISNEQKQVCFRELKTFYLEASDAVFNQKKKYLGVIHEAQVKKLNQLQSNMRTEIEKSF